MNDPYPSRCADEPSLLLRRDLVLHSTWDATSPLGGVLTEQAA